MYLREESDSEEFEELSLESLDELLLDRFLLFLRFSAKMITINHISKSSSNTMLCDLCAKDKFL